MEPGEVTSEVVSKKSKKNSHRATESTTQSSARKESSGRATRDRKRKAPLRKKHFTPQQIKKRKWRWLCCITVLILLVVAAALIVTVLLTLVEDGGPFKLSINNKGGGKKETAEETKKGEGPEEIVEVEEFEEVEDTGEAELTPYPDKVEGTETQKADSFLDTNSSTASLFLGTDSPTASWHQYNLRFPPSSRPTKSTAPSPRPTKYVAPTSSPLAIVAIVIIVQLDTKPEEIGLSLASADLSTTYISHPIGSFAELKSEVVMEVFNIPERMDLVFEISESGSGDGLCCTHGHGYYRVLSGTGHQKATLISGDRPAKYSFTVGMQNAVQIGNVDPNEYCKPCPNGNECGRCAWCDAKNGFLSESVFSYSCRSQRKVVRRKCFIGKTRFRLHNQYVVATAGACVEPEDYEL